ncbi:hypothetical protein [Leptodesmis sp.]
MAELHFKTQAQDNLWLLGQCRWEVDRGPAGTTLVFMTFGKTTISPGS